MKILTLSFVYFLIIIFGSINAFSQNNIDSLTNLLQKTTQDSVKLNLLVILSENCDEQDILSYAKPAVKLAEKLLHQSAALNDPKIFTYILNKKALALNNIGYYYWQKGVSENAVHFFKMGLEIRERTNDKLGIAESLNNLGELCRLQGDISLALEYFNKSLKMRDEINDVPGYIVSLNNISLIYLQQGIPEQALKYYSMGLESAEKINDEMGKAFLLNNIGQIHHFANDTIKAMLYYNRSLSLFRQLQHKQGIATVLNNMGSIYFNVEHNLDKALRYFEESASLSQESGDRINYTSALVNIGTVLLNKNENYLALECGHKAMNSARATGSPDNIKRASQLLYSVYKSTGDYKNALVMHELNLKMRDSLVNEKNQRSTIQQQLKYDYDKQQVLKDADHQKELAIAEEERKRQQVISWSIGIGLLMAILFTVFIFNRLRITRKQKQVIELQKIVVDQKNKHITDSINYAKKIQDAILPSTEELKVALNEHFVFFRPLEIVSGDFYWLSTQGDKTIVVVADCTGHGVPGAFMSMIGNTLLNEIVNEKKIFQPGEILDRLNDGVIQALHQDSRAQDDGMDVSVCLFNKGSVTFAGANHSLYVVCNNMLEEIKGDIHSIGSAFGPKGAFKNKNEFTFSEKTFSPAKGTTIFLTSDGFADQRGGENGRNYSTQRMKLLMANVGLLKSTIQKEKIETDFTEWKREYAQLDDVLVIGIKIS